MSKSVPTKSTHDLLTSPTELKKYRTDHSLTQVQVADLLHISVRTYEKWEQYRQIPAGYWELLVIKVESLDKNGKNV